MDVRDLAPSLLALADLYSTAHTMVGSGAQLPPALDVRATEEGSFVIDLLLYFRELSAETGGLLATPGVVATVTGIQLAEYVTQALRWSLLRFRLGREQTILENAPEPGQIRVEWANGDTIECPVEAQALVESMDFNRTAGRVFEPLRRDGIDSIELRRSGPSSTITVARDQLGAFNVLEGEDEILSQNTRQIVITLESIAFNPTNKWRVNDGTATFWTSITDLDFLQRFTAGEEAFAVGDTLLVSLRDVQYRGPGRTIRVEHFIEHVLEHRRREEDSPLFE